MTRSAFSVSGSMDRSLTHTPICSDVIEDSAKTDSCGDSSANRIFGRQFWLGFDSETIVIGGGFRWCRAGQLPSGSNRVLKNYSASSTIVISNPVGRFFHDFRYQAQDSSTGCHALDALLLRSAGCGNFGSEI